MAQVVHQCRDFLPRHVTTLMDEVMNSPNRVLKEWLEGREKKAADQSRAERMKQVSEEDGAVVEEDCSETEEAKLKSVEDKSECVVVVCRGKHD